MESSRKLKLTKKTRLIILISIVMLLVLAGAIYLNSKNVTQNGGPIVNSSKQVKSQRISPNLLYELPVGQAKDNLTPLKITFQTSQLTNRIVVNRKYRYSRDGALYLMINVLIENNNTKRLTFKTKDIVRLIDSNGKKFAPSLYNKDLTLEPDAVKKDTVGFLVPDDLKVFSIQYGSITGEKKLMELKFN